MLGDVEVRHGDERLDAMSQHLVDHRLVEVQARLVGLSLVAVGEDAAPAERGAEGLEPHLGKEGYVLLVVVIEVDGVARRKVMRRVIERKLQCSGHHRKAIGTRGNQVAIFDATASLLPAALRLGCRNRSAPKEPVRKRHGTTSSIECRWDYNSCLYF